RRIDKAGLACRCSSVQRWFKRTLLYLRESGFELACLLDRFAFAEILELEELPQLDFAGLLLAVRGGHAQRPLQCFLPGLHLNHPVAGDQVLAVGKRAIHYRALAA